MASAWRQRRAIKAIWVLKNEKSVCGIVTLPDWHLPPLNPDFESLFQALEEPDARPSEGRIADRYRLVGAMLHAADPARSTAFIEEKNSGRQRRLRVGEELEASVTVKSIASAEVWVVGPDGEECLVRDGRSVVLLPGTGVAKGTDGDGLGGEGLSRFGGERTGTNSWNFSRGAIMGYYQELMDRPERLVKVFDSLAPVYDDLRRIEGYRVTIRGEADFFDAVGLHDGDVVRSVNSIEMTNRRRAENLIGRFTQNDLDLVIIELDRDGRRIKQYYDTTK